jgi:hypothetical protein
MNASTSVMNAPGTPRSTLVSVLAWLGIVLGALTACSALAEFAFWGSLAEAPSDLDPAVQKGLFHWVQGLTLLNLAIAGFMVYTGYALWKRRNWARITYIVLFIIGIVANVIGIAVAGLFGSLFAQVGTPFGVVFVVIALLSLSVIVLFAWFIRRLASARVKAEFASISPVV